MTLADELRALAEEMEERERGADAEYDRLAPRLLTLAARAERESLTDSERETMGEQVERLRDMVNMVDGSIEYGTKHGAANWRGALEEVQIKLKRRIAALAPIAEKGNTP